MNRVAYIGFFRRGRGFGGKFLPERNGVLVIAAPLRMLCQFASRAWAMFGRQAEVKRLRTSGVRAIAIAALVQKSRKTE